MSIEGLFTALITPFQEDGSVDFSGLKENVRFQVKSGVDGFVVLGTTGEAPTLSDEEKEQIVALVVEEAKEKCHICVGTGANSTAATIANTTKAKEWGADSALIVTPYYNRPTQKGVFEHFQAVSKEIDIPVVVYNHPGRTGTNIEALTMREIANLPNIIGVKESSGDIGHAADIIGLTTTVSGIDEMTLPMIALGGVGLMSVIANLLPVPMVELASLCNEGDFKGARELHYRLLPLFKAMAFESNPIPVKAAMNLFGLPAGPCRLPLSEMGKAPRDVLKQLMTDAGLL